MYPKIHQIIPTIITINSTLILNSTTLKKIINSIQNQPSTTTYPTQKTTTTKLKKKLLTHQTTQYTPITNYVTITKFVIHRPTTKKTHHTITTMKTHTQSISIIQNSTTILKIITIVTKSKPTLIKQPTITPTHTTQTIINIIQPILV